jgi:predicted house-cleaning noncanonical NTP pyrophosphatase (MazG superfamily)
MKKDYNKLVRDLIPEIIQKSGNKCVISTLNDEDYAKELEKKLLEEVNEYLSDKNAEELADILEVLYALAALKGVTACELEQIRAKKSKARGGFENKIFLHSVIEEK